MCWCTEWTKVRITNDSPHFFSRIFPECPIPTKRFKLSPTDLPYKYTRSPRLVKPNKNTLHPPLRTSPFSTGSSQQHRIPTPINLVAFLLAQKRGPPRRRRFGRSRPFWVVEIDVMDSESLRVTGRPLEVVEERPCVVALHISTVPISRVDGDSREVH